LSYGGFCCALVSTKASEGRDVLLSPILALPKLECNESEGGSYGGARML